MPDQPRAMFFFGSMRDDRVLEAVLGRKFSTHSIPVVLKDHAAMTVADTAYPTLRYQPRAMCFGQLRGGLTPADLVRIEFWEDGEYGLATMVVHDHDDQPHDALVYATSIHEATDTPWAFAAFQAGVPEYLDEVREWMAKS